MYKKKSLMYQGDNADVTKKFKVELPSFLPARGRGEDETYPDRQEREARALKGADMKRILVH